MKGNKLKKWIRSLEALPEDEALEEANANREKAEKLRREADDLIREATALETLVEGRRRLAARDGLPPGIVSAGGKVMASTGMRQAPIEKATTIGTSAAVLEVMATEPEREWRVLDILQALEERDRLPRSSDPRRALDATVHRLAKRTRQIEHVGPGRYKLPPVRADGQGDAHAETFELREEGR
jgi:hypothetical protein